MDNKKLETELKSYFQSEVEKIEPPAGWWQRVVSRASAHPQEQKEQNTNLPYRNLRILSAKLELLLKSALSSLHINYKAPLFYVSAYAVLAILLIGSSVGIGIAINNMTKVGSPSLSGPPSLSGVESIPVTIIGLEQGEEATLRIGLETESLAIENTILEYRIQGTGASLTKSITPDLEDGYYLMELEVPGKYTVGVRAYSFTVSDSVVVNPTGKAVTFELGLQSDPSPPSALRPVISFSAPPQVTMALSTQDSIGQRVLMPLAILTLLIAAVLLVIVVRRHRSQMKL